MSSIEFSDFYNPTFYQEPKIPPKSETIKMTSPSIPLSKPSKGLGKAIAISFSLAIAMGIATYQFLKRYYVTSPKEHDEDKKNLNNLQWAFVLSILTFVLSITILKKYYV